MKKAIVTGSTGFIGSSFVEYLNKKNIQVLSLGRKAWSDIPSFRKNKIKQSLYCQLDMANILQLPNIIKSVGWEPEDDCIFFNLAWGGRNTLSDMNIEAQMSNVAWSVSALEAAQAIGCSRFIHAGTMEEAFTEKYLDLDHNKDNQFNRHVIYSVAKLAARNALQIRSRQIGMQFIYVLHSHVMGEYDDKDSFLQVTLKKLICNDDLIFSTGEQYFDVISLDDCALGYYLICQKGKPGQTYWVGSGDPRPLREYVERMYHLYPSSKEMQFGRLPYNDIVLNKEQFSIQNLVRDTGYRPTMSYEQTVQLLYEHLIAINN